MIGIICAMEAEVAALRDSMAIDRTEKVSGIQFHLGHINGCKVVLAQCGIGKVFAAICAQTMVVRYGVDTLLNCGVSGTLTAKLHIGDVIISSHCVQHDMDTSAVGDPVGLISGINRVEFPADAKLVAELEAVCQKAGVHYLTGPIATGDQFVASQARRDWIVEHFRADSVEMESGSVAQVAYVNAIPYVILRVISDEADGHATIDYPTFMRQAAKTSSDIVLAWLKARAVA